MPNGHPNPQPQAPQESDHTRVIRDRMNEIQAEMDANKAQLEKLRAEEAARAQQPTQVIIIKGLE